MTFWTFLLSSEFSKSALVRPHSQEIFFFFRRRHLCVSSLSWLCCPDDVKCNYYNLANQVLHFAPPKEQDIDKMITEPKASIAT